MKLLITDDSSYIRTRIKIMMKEVPAITEILEAENAEQANQLILDESPDILILDIVLKYSNGFDVMEFMNATSMKKPMVIMLTNSSSQWHKNKFFEYGGDYFLDKSQEFDQLDLIIATHILKKEMMEEKEKNINC